MSYKHARKVRRSNANVTSHEIIVVLFVVGLLIILVASL
jgi:hypothetical protein